jgi:hypothetical protein
MMNMLVSGAALAASKPVTPAFAEISRPISQEPYSAAARLWQDRQRHVEKLIILSAARDEAYERLPDWAKPGPRCIDHEGNPSDHEVGWPLDPTVTSSDSPGAFRVVRPSPWEAKRDFDFQMRAFAGPPGSPHYDAVGANARIVARLRERKQLYPPCRLWSRPRAETQS